MTNGGGACQVDPMSAMSEGRRREGAGTMGDTARRLLVRASDAEHFREGRFVRNSSPDVFSRNMSARLLTCSLETYLLYHNPNPNPANLRLIWLGALLVH